MAVKFKLDQYFDHAKADLPNKEGVLELSKDGNDDYDLFLHNGDHVEHLVTLTYNELKCLWHIVSNNG